VNVIIGIKTFAPLQHMRMGHLENCLHSAVSEFGAENVVVFNNGGLDHEAVQEAALDAGSGTISCGPTVVAHASPKGARTPGHGARALVEMARRWTDVAGRLPDIVVHSDDDMIWRSGAREALVEIWTHAPDKLLICSGLLEPDYPWATVRRAEDLGRQRVLIRDNAPGCAWSLRARYAAQVADAIEGRFGFDHEACKTFLGQGYELAQADLAEHAGWGASTHGNEAIDAPTTKPLDRQKWGI